MKPAFLSRDMADDDLADDLAALRQGRYPGWRLAAEIAYESAARTGDALVLYRWRRLWLCTPSGQQQVVTLRHPRSQGVWQRAESADAGNPLAGR